MPGQNGLRVGEAFGRNFTQKRQRDVIIGRDAISAGHPRFGSAGGEGGFRADVVGERKTVKQTHDQHLKKESRDYCNGFSLAAQVCYNQNRMRKRGDKRLDANGRCLSAGGQPDDEKKAFDYVQDGRVITIHAENESDGVRYTARVRGRYDLYQTWYKETDTQIVGGCTCPAFERTRTACKHIAALMIENMARQEYEREARQRQQEYEKRRREEQARENEAFINRMIQLGEKARMPAEQTDGRRIRLYPVLERADMQCVELEFKVGREGARAYIVRNRGILRSAWQTAITLPTAKGLRLPTTGR